MAVSQKISNVIVPIADRKSAAVSIFHLVDCGYFCEDLLVDVFVAVEPWHSLKYSTIMEQNKTFH
jgi:hypothetical protein